MISIPTQILMAGGIVGAPGGQPSPWPLIMILVAVFYFIVLRPQQKQVKTETQMRSALMNGDEVITSGGMYGKVKEVSETTVLLEIHSGGRIKVAKNHIAGNLTQSADTSKKS